MVSTHLDSVLKKLSQNEFDPGLDNSRKIQLYELQMKLRFLKMFFWCYENWDYTGNKNMNSDSFISEFEVILQEMAVDFEHWEGFANQLLVNMEHFKPQIKEICFDWLNCSLSLLPFKSSKTDDFNDFIVTILQNLEDFLGLKHQMIVPVKEQIEMLQQKLKLFGNLVKFTPEIRFCNRPYRVSKSRNNILGELIDNLCNVFRISFLNPCNPELSNFRDQVQTWTIKVASLSFLYWVDNLEGETITELNTIYLDVLQQIKPRSPEAIRMFLVVLKEALVSIRSNTLLMGDSVDMLLENLMSSMEDSFRMTLRDGLIILITFLIDPPKRCGKNGNEIFAKADALVDEAASLISSLSSNEEKDCIPNGRDFLKKIDTLKEEIKENYVQIQDLSWSEFPRTNGLGFLDFLLENLKEKASSISFAKCLLLAMQEKLISTRPYLKDVMERQNEFDKTKDLWLRILSVAYAVEHTVDSCFFEGNQLWYKMICLYIFLEKIELLIKEVEKIRDESVYKSRVPNAEMNPSHMIPKYAKTSCLEGAVVGFKNEAEAIFDQLMGGSKQPEMVSIVGMAGQGKTTLANKVYNDPSIRNRFHKLAWCFVSQVYQWKELLLDILSDITVLDHAKIHGMSEEELAEKLYRCLKGQKYLIVLDDIWDIKAWHQLRESFPNDENGSRIMITSRIHTMASQTNLCSSTHVLCPLSTEESLELLQKKLFNEDGFPEYLSEVGLQIVNLCEGLPLSIVVIAGVLAKRIRNQTWWKEIATNLSSKILGEEGCMNILELSYRQLPEHLKPCFLYFGAFQQGKVVKVQKLIQLWVAEGFIPKIGSKRPEEVALNFLMDLIVRSLVVVVERSSDIKIKVCRIHDLLFDLCLAKVEQDRFLRSLKDAKCPENIKYERHRLSILIAWRYFFQSNPTALYARTLLFPKLGHSEQHSDDSSFLMKFKFLRVLDLEYPVVFDRFPEEITSLIHLRYLAIRGTFALSPNIGNLLNLEVLCVNSDNNKIMVPPAIWKMKRLRHICLRAAPYFFLGNSSLEDAQLDNVDTLSWLMICGDEYSKELLRRFPKVRKLKFRFYDYQGQCLQFPALDFLSNLEILDVRCFLTGMNCPCDFKLPSTLKKLTLSLTGLPWNEVSAIAKLPNLEVLKLLFAFVGESWVLEDEEEFRKLKFLKLRSASIRQWNASADSFPCLERLVLEKCDELEEIPSDFGEISTMDLIEVHSCSNGAEISAREILNVQQENGNDGFVVIITSNNYNDKDGGKLGNVQAFMANGVSSTPSSTKRSSDESQDLDATGFDSDSECDGSVAATNS